ncbi:MAG: acyl-CoA thioesterase [Polyangiaceae bacterium]|nr:acyl-CoA thioesterase [Polyangiaceae bacterium]
MSLPEPPPHAFLHRIVVGDGDLDELRHVNNVRWLRFVIDAAVAHSSAVGLDLAAYLALGVVWVVRRQEMDYLRPAAANEVITAHTWVESFGESSSLRRTLVVRDTDRCVLLAAATTWVMVDRQGRPTPVPRAVRERFTPSGSG